MPNDLTLYPSISNPQQRQIERTAALESRVAALERTRDIYVTPVNLTVAAGSGTVTIPFDWHGGRLWGTFGGRGQNTQASQPASVGYQVKVNAYPTFSLGVRGTSTSGLFDWSLGMVADTLPAAALTPGPNVLTIGRYAGADADNSYVVSGLLVEWPYA